MKIVSGGQTGVDRAALDAAMEAGLPIGGWCPKGRRAEDGEIDARYGLRETPSPAYRQRTEWNVRDSDGTLVLRLEGESAGTDWTEAVAGRLGRPFLRIDLTAAEPGDVPAWIARHGIRVLNVAGPRERETPGIYTAARQFLARVFQAGRGTRP